MLNIKSSQLIYTILSSKIMCLYVDFSNSSIYYTRERSVNYEISGTKQYRFFRQ